MTRDLVSTMQSNDAPVLATMFARFGLDPSVSQQLQDHLGKIHEAALGANNSIAQLQEARYEFDKRVRSSLSPGDYAEYRSFETSRPAKREYDLLSAFAAKRNVTIDPVLQNQLVGVIQAAGAFTTTSELGPYDGIPMAGFGIENVVAHMKEQLADTQGKLPVVAQKAEDAGLPAAYQDLLRAYYTQKISEQQTGIESAAASGDPHALLRQLQQRRAQAPATARP